VSFQLVVDGLYGETHSPSVVRTDFQASFGGGGDVGLVTLRPRAGKIVINTTFHPGICCLLLSSDLALDWCGFADVDVAAFFRSVEEEEVILSTCTADDDAVDEVELEDAADVFAAILTGSIGLPSVIGDVDGADLVIHGHQWRCSSNMLNASSNGS